MVRQLQQLFSEKVHTQRKSNDLLSDMFELPAAGPSLVRILFPCRMSYQQELTASNIFLFFHAALRSGLRMPPSAQQFCYSLCAPRSAMSHASRPLLSKTLSSRSMSAALLYSLSFEALHRNQLCEARVQDNTQTFKYDHYCGHSVMFREFISSATVFELQLPATEFTVRMYF